MAGPSIGTWVKVRTKTGLTPRVIPIKNGGGSYSQGQVITQSEFNEIRQKPTEGKLEVSQVGQSRQERRLEQKKKKVERLQGKMDSLVASDNIPGSFVAGRSGYSLGKKRDAMNDRLSNTYRDLESTKDEVKQLESSISFRKAKPVAKSQWNEHGKEMVDHYAKTTGKPRKDVKDALDSMAKWKPNEFIKMVDKYLETKDNQ